jgi:cobalt-zinc-cadmium efflux system protein
MAGTQGDHDHHHDHAHAGHSDHHDHHGHSHGFGHAHVPANFGRAFAIGILLNLGFVIVEAGYGLIAQSMSLIADAGHNLGDVLGLIMAWVASILARRLPSQSYTYGMRRGTILAALGNALVLLIAVGAIVVESIQRLIEPQPVASITVMVVATIGIAINGLTAYLFAAGRKGDLNVKGAFLHMVYDALVSASVVVVSLGILWTGWTILDPLTGLAIAAIMVFGTWGLLRDSIGLSLDAVPVGIELDAVRRLLLDQPGVAKIHDLHIWPISTTETALTCHLHMPRGNPGDEFLVHLHDALKNRFGIGHSTIQIEVNEDMYCELRPDHVV